MCKIYTNTRWLCNLTDKCKPHGRQCLQSYFSPKAPPSRKACPQFNALLNRCTGPGKTVIDSNEVFYLTFSCPTHHKKRMSSLQLHWEVEWSEQIIEAKTVEGYREYAQRKKWAMDVKRDLVFVEIMTDAKMRNEEVYVHLWSWQVKTIADVRKELLEVMEWD